MAELNIRYGWLITDAELVVFRVSVELTGPGQAIDRPQREPSTTLGHNRMSSAETEPAPPQPPRPPQTPPRDPVLTGRTSSNNLASCVVTSDLDGDTTAAGVPMTP